MSFSPKSRSNLMGDLVLTAQFDSADELYMHAVDQVLNHGYEIDSRDGPTMETCGFVARLLDPTAHFIFNPNRKLSPAYAAAEVIWYLSGERSIDRIQPYAPQYARFANQDQKGEWYAHGAYGYRWGSDPHFQRVLSHVSPSHPVLKHLIGKSCLTQLSAVAQMLRDNPGSRQAVMTCFAASDLLWSLTGEIKDIPCTLSLNFRIIDGKLCLAVTMRSNDIWLGLPYDMYAFTTIQMLLARWIGCDVGWYQHQVMSLHCYNRNRIKAEKCLRPPSFSTGGIDYGHTPGLGTGDELHSLIAKALKFEEFFRTHVPGGSANGVEAELGSDSLLLHLVLQASSNWADGSKLDDLIKRIPTKLMANYLKWFRGMGKVK